MASESFSLTGGTGSGSVNINFTATGSQYALSYVETLVGAVNSILGSGGEAQDVSPNTSGAAYFPGAELPGGTAIYQLVPSTVVVGVQTYDITSPGYVLDTIGGSVAINTDSAGGDTILVVADNPFTTVHAAGTDNLVLFVDGNNVYDGSGSGGGDTVVGGDGNATIATGTAGTTISSGTGYDLITLNDTGTGAYQDAVYLDGGHAQVFADGSGDYVVATTEGQTITGAATPIDSSAVLTVVLLPNSDGTSSGNDVINAGGAFTTVSDASSDNTINGGSGGLTFIGGADVSATINVGSGAAFIFGNSGETLTIGNVSGESGPASIYAGGGNETLNGGSATGNLLVFGASQSDSVGAVDSLVGGSGNDTLVGGSGVETLVGGAGANTFLVDFYGSENANLTIADFTASDTLQFGHYSQADINAALQGGQVVDGNFVVTFGTSSTTITFTGITDASQLSGHIISF